MKRLTLIKSQKVTGWLSENFEIQVSADTEEQCFFTSEAIHLYAE